jgi:hypothetical protein
VASTRSGLVYLETRGERCWVRDLLTGTALASSTEDWPALNDVHVAAIAEVRGRLLLAVATRTGLAHVYDFLTGRPFPDPVELGFPVRSLALGDVDGRALLAAVNETEGELGLVVTREATSHARARPAAIREYGRVLGVGRRESEILGLVDGLGLVDLETGEIVDAAPSPEAVGRILFGRPGLSVEEPEAARATRSSGGLRVDRATDWPETARAHGIVDGQPVIARGSYGGVVVVFDATNGRLARADRHTLPHQIQLGRKPGPTSTTGISVGAGDGCPVIALACDGTVSLRDARTLAIIPIDWVRARSVAAVALGDVCGSPLLATGGEGGGIALWDLRHERRLAGITLDTGITGLWLLPGDDVLVAKTADGILHLFDIVTRSDPAPPEPRIRAG